MNIKIVTIGFLLSRYAKDFCMGVILLFTYECMKFLCLFTSEGVNGYILKLLVGFSSAF